MCRPKKRTATKKKQQEGQPLTVRRTLHPVLATRKSGQHQRDSEKRAAQKLRRTLEQDESS